MPLAGAFFDVQAASSMLMVMTPVRRRLVQSIMSTIQ